MRIVGIDPGSERTGYGCVETDGRRHRLVTCGAITAAAADAFPDRLARIYRELSALLLKMRPECVAVESVFHAVNARSALKLGHARGVALLAAVEAGCTVVEYTPAEVKRAVVGYGRADKRQVQHMVTLLLGLAQPPTPYDASDALAVAICHLHSAPFGTVGIGNRDRGSNRRDLALVADRLIPHIVADTTSRILAAVPSSRARMIAFLRGRVHDKQPNRVIVDVGGIGYDVHVPLSTFYNLGDEGAEVSLRVHTHVREDALQLYGFLTELERQVFERLIAISGIGPKLAIVVLSGMEPRELVTAVQRADVARLTTIPGIGKKTAERIVLELKDRLTQIAVPAAPGAAAPESSADQLRFDLLSALLNLGYHRQQAEKAIDATVKSNPDASFEHAVRTALRELMR